jgi:hypothetical protein
MSAREHVWQSYADERDKLRQRVAANLRTDMSRLVGQPDHADIELIASDGVRLSAHVAVVKQRAPGFFRRYVQPAMGKPSGKGGQVQLTDVNGEMLRFFMEAVYTKDDVADNPLAQLNRDRPPEFDDDDLAGGGGGSGGGGDGPGKLVVGIDRSVVSRRSMAKPVTQLMRSGRQRNKKA